MSPHSKYLCLFFFFSLGRSGRGVTIVSGDRPICFLQAGSIRLYLLWISSAFVATTLAVFSNHQLSCQINEPFHWSMPPPLNRWLKQTVMNKGEGCFEKKTENCQGKKQKHGCPIKAPARVSRITRMTHPVHFTSGRKRENMWKFNDPKRNTVFGKSDEKMSRAEDVKNKTQNAPCNLVLAETSLSF